MSRADMSLGVEGGGLGHPLTLTLEGPPNQSYLLIMSLTTGPTITPWITLDVGLDLLNYSTLIPGFMGTFDANGIKVLPLAAPSDPLLNGLNLNFQNCLLNNMAPPILDVSNLYRVTFATPNTFAYTLETLPDYRYGMAVAPLADGTVLLAGGTIDAPVYKFATDEILIYRPNLEAFELAPFSLPAPRTDMTATVLKDGKVLFLGGLNLADDPTATAWLFDPSTSGFSNVGPMSLTRSMYQSVLLDDGRVLILGGYTDNTDEITMINTLRSTTEIFDPAIPGFYSGADMAKPRTAFTATVLDNGQVLVAGGVSYFKLFGVKIPELLDLAQVYTPSPGGAGSFGTSFSMSKTRAAHSAFRLPGGKVLISSGATGTFINYAITPTCELFNPSNPSFGNTGELEEGRIWSFQAPLPDGTLIAMAGGTGDLTNPIIIGTSEIYDPVAEKWTGGPDLGIPRFLSGFASLPDGTVLIAGGLTGSPAAGVNTAEIYQPK
jgi:hypothetical protein